MKDEKPNTGFGPDYVGWAVPVIATAYVMANSLEEAREKVGRGLRMQARVLLVKIETLQPVQTERPEVIENSPLPTFTRAEVMESGRGIVRTVFDIDPLDPRACVRKVTDLMARDTIENIPVETTTTQLVVNGKEETVTIVSAVPPCTFCDHHKKDISKKGACTPGQTCHAEYWRTKLGGK
jgi:hypothetical protein